MNQTTAKRLLAVLLVLLSAFRIVYILHGPLSLAPDEAYFWDWGRHPAWGYYDMSPMIGWIIGLSTHFLGDTEFGVRIGAVLFSAATSIVFFQLTLDVLSDPVLALAAATLWNLVPIGATGSIVHTYYSPQVFLWALTLLFVRRAVDTGRGGWWAGVGLSVGLGLVAHYTFLTLSGQIFLYLLFSARARPWLARPHPYLAAVLAALLFTPTLVWNAHHDWAMFRHASGQLGNGHTILRSALDYIGGQIGVMSPVVWLGVAAALVVCAARAVLFSDDTAIFLFFTSAPLLLFIGSLSLAKRTEANWPVSAYISGLIALFWMLQGWSKRARRTYLVFALGTAGLISAVAHFPSLLCRIYDLPPRKDPSNRLYGWRELGEHLTAAREKYPNTFLCSLEYAMPAELSFYTAGHPQGYTLPVSWRRTQYDYWNLNGETGRDALYVHNGDGEIDPRVLPLFSSVTLIDRFTVYKTCGRGLPRRTFSIFLCRGFKGAEPNPARSY